MSASPPPIDRARDLSDVAAGTPAKGDVLAHNGTAYAKVAVGSDTQVLTADSAQASGVKWATPAAAPVTSVAGRTGAVVLSTGDVSGLGTAATHPATDFVGLSGTLAGNFLSGATGTSAGDSGYGPGSFDSAGSAAGVSSDLSVHEADTNNPHGVTAAQVGLGAVLDAKQVTSIALATPSVVYATPINFAVDASGNATGTLSLNMQSANLVFAGPAASPSATPTFRALAVADLPTHVGGTGTELQYRSTNNTTAAVTGSSVSGANVTLSSVAVFKIGTSIDLESGYGGFQNGVVDAATRNYQFTPSLLKVPSTWAMTWTAVTSDAVDNPADTRIQRSAAKTVLIDDGSTGAGGSLILTNLTTYGGNVILSNLAAPTGLSATPQGTTGSTTYAYVVSAVDAQGETVASTAGTTATGNATLTGTNKNHLAFNGSNGATSYNVRRTVGGATTGVIGTVTATGAASYAFDDTGLAGDSTSAPTTPTGTGLTIKAWQGQNTGVLTLQNSSGATYFTTNPVSGTISMSGFISLPNGSAFANDTGFWLGINAKITWGNNNNATGSQDTAFIRVGPAAVKVTNASTGLGSLIYGEPVVSKTGTYTVAATDGVILANANTGAFTVTLPTAASITGQCYTVKKTDSSGNAVTVGTTSSQTIDGSTTYSLASQNKYVTAMSDGSNWQIVANN